MSKLELGLAKDVTVDICCAQRLARRLLDPAVTPEQSDLSPAAIVILSSDLLPGWYDDWVLVEAEDWVELRLHALEMLADRLTAVGCLGQATDAARAAVRAEPLRESADAALIQVHLARDQLRSCAPVHTLPGAAAHRAWPGAHSAAASPYPGSSEPEPVTLWS